MESVPQAPPCAALSDRLTDNLKRAAERYTAEPTGFWRQSLLCALKYLIEEHNAELGSVDVILSASEVPYEVYQ